DLARANSEALAVGLHFQHEIYGFAETVLKARAIRALEGVAARYPIHRSVRCAARRKVEEIFDDLALHSGFGASRLDATSLLLDGPGVFIEAEGSRKADYSSCSFAIWTDSTSRADELRDLLFRLVGERYSREQMFTIDWHFTDRRAGRRSSARCGLSCARRSGARFREPVSGRERDCAGPAGIAGHRQDPARA